MITISENDYTIVEATVYYLEMHEKPLVRQQAVEDVHFELLPQPVEVSDYKKLYYDTGFVWNWIDRLVMDEQLLDKKINADNIEIYKVVKNGMEAGFAEFMFAEKYTEIVYFGLMPAYTGKGMGKFFLDWVIAKAWERNPEWIQLNTCSLDHPNALKVYQALGFKIINVKKEERKYMLQDKYKIK